MTTFQSRWGFHPCTFETFRKLKRLHKAYWEGRRLLAKQRRWNAKLPDNRSGPEPVVPPVYRVICASPIISEFHAARHGVPTAEAVKPLKILAVQMEAWVQALDELASVV